VVSYSITGDANSYEQVTAFHHTTFTKICKACGLYFIKRVQLQNELLQITLERAGLLSVLFNDADKNGYTAESVKIIVARVLLYGCENWKINKADKRRTETAENTVFFDR